MTDLTEAHEMFMQYAGSTFYMSRNGVEDTYRSFGVPKETEQAWLEELIPGWLDLLGTADGWWCVSHLVHHSRFEFLNNLLDHPPIGLLWQRCAYLELTLKYLDRCAGDQQGRLGYSPKQLRTALQWVIDLSVQLQDRSREAATVARVDRLEQDARSRLAVATSAGLWRWDALARRATAP